MKRINYDALRACTPEILHRTFIRCSAQAPWAALTAAEEGLDVWTKRCFKTLHDLADPAALTNIGLVFATLARRDTVAGLTDIRLLNSNNVEDGIRATFIPDGRLRTVSESLVVDAGHAFAILSNPFPVRVGDVVVGDRIRAAFVPN